MADLSQESSLMDLEETPEVFNFFSSFLFVSARALTLFGIKSPFTDKSSSISDRTN